MAFDEALAGRVRDQLQTRAVMYTEKKMFGGLSFLIGGNLSVGIVKDELIVRLPPEGQASALAEEPHLRPMDFTGKPMRGWLTLDHAGTQDAEILSRWVERSVGFAQSLPAK